MEKLKPIIHKINNQSGLTLVELLASLVLITLVLIMVTSIHLMGLKQYNTQSQTIKHQENVRLAMTSLTKAIRRADSVYLISSTDAASIVAQPNSVNMDTIINNTDQNLTEGDLLLKSKTETKTMFTLYTLTNNVIESHIYSYTPTNIFIGQKINPLANDIAQFNPAWTAQASHNAVTLNLTGAQNQIRNQETLSTILYIRH